MATNLKKLSKREKREATQSLVRFVFLVVVILIAVCGAILGYHDWETGKSQQKIQKQALKIARNIMQKNLEDEILDTEKWKKLISECKDGLGELRVKILENKDEISSWEEQVKRVDEISSKADKLLEEYEGNIEQGRKMLGSLNQDILALINGFESGK